MQNKNFYQFIKKSSFEINFKATRLALRRLEKIYRYFAKHYPDDYALSFFYTKIDSLANNKVQNIENEIKEITTLVPDSEDYPELWSNLASNALICLVLLYEFYKTEDRKIICRIYELIDDMLFYYSEEEHELYGNRRLSNLLEEKELGWRVDVYRYLLEGNSVVNIKNKDYLLPHYEELFRC